MATKIELSKEQLKQLGSDIALCLCEQTKQVWTVSYGNDWNIVIGLHCNGRQRVWAKSGWDKPGMLTCFASMNKEELPPNNRDYKYSEARKGQNTSINVSLSREPEAIAKDIVKRLLPIANELVAAAKLDKDNEQKRQAYETECVDNLTRAIGNAGEYRDGKASGHSPYINLKLGEGYGEIKAAFYSEGNASVDISLKSLPLETAIKVCQALATIKSNKTNA
jgi:hypothetical protein